MHESPADQVDVLIAGGGPIGSAIARALSDTPLRVALIDPAVPAAADPRPIALSEGSRLILEQLGCWPSADATTIAEIHVSHQGRFGRTRMSAAEHALPALGHVIAYGRLHRATSGNTGCRHITGLVDAVDDCGDFAAAVTSGTRIAARLIVLADGGHLARTQSESYPQVALVANIDADQPHRGRAWERFTPHGPLALLPFGRGYAMVWCTTPERAQALETAGQTMFLQALQQAFGHRAGRFTAASERSRFPLALRRAGRAPARCVTVGNSAQTLHPVAGQGLNLGLRDAVELACLVRDCAPQDLGSPDFVSRFQAARAPDRNAGVRVTDQLVRLFSNANPVAGLARGTGLFMLDLMPAPRRFLARRMMFGMRALP
jgi:2-octaprenyl-6-methoxyphenol hydroxylase